MKISYLSSSPLDKKVANAVHVMHMSGVYAESSYELYWYVKGIGKDFSIFYE